MDDYAAFAAMLRFGGVLHGERVLSRPSVALVTTDQLAPSVKACSGIAPGDDPAEDLTAILLTQRALGVVSSRHDFPRLLDDGVPGHRRLTLVSTDLSELGRYEAALAAAPPADGQDVSDWEMREYFEFF